MSEHGEDEMEEGEYDLMEYGDEMNDAEERNYAREVYGKKPEPAVKQYSRRANRGQRMGALVERAARQEGDEDDDFWGGLGAEFFGISKDNKEEEAELMQGLLADDDQDFDSKEASEAEAADSFDSDFGKGDTEEETSVQDGKKRAAPEVDEDELLAREER